MAGFLFILALNSFATFSILVASKGGSTLNSAKKTCGIEPR